MKREEVYRKENIVERKKNEKELRLRFSMVWRITIRLHRSSLPLYGYRQEIKGKRRSANGIKDCLLGRD